MRCRLLLCGVSSETDLESMVRVAKQWLPFWESDEGHHIRPCGISKKPCLAVVLPKLPAWSLSKGLHDQLVSVLEEPTALLILGTMEEEPPSWVFDEFRDGIIVSARVAEDWRLLDKGLPCFGESEDQLWYLAPNEVESHGHEPDETVRRLGQMRNIPQHKEGNVVPQIIMVSVSPEMTLDDLSRVAYQDVFDVSDELKGVGGRNALLITSSEHSGLSGIMPHEHWEHHGHFEFSFMNSAACNLHFVDPKEGGETIVDRLLDEKIALISAVAEQERR